MDRRAREEEEEGGGAEERRSDQNRSEILIPFQSVLAARFPQFQSTLSSVEELVKGSMVPLRGRDREEALARCFSLGGRNTNEHWASDLSLNSLPESSLSLSLLVGGFKDSAVYFLIQSKQQRY